MNLLKHMSLVAALGMSAPLLIFADESGERPASRKQDSLLKKAYDTKDKRILDLIRNQEKKNGKEGLNDPTFRYKLRREVELFVAEEDSEDTEGVYCASCHQRRVEERRRSGLTDSEIQSVRTLIARSQTESNQNWMRISTPTASAQFGNSPQYGSANQFGGSFFNTQGSSDMMLLQMFASLMQQNQMYQGYGQNFGYPQNYGYGQNYGWNSNPQAPALISSNQWRQAPVFASPLTSSYSGLNYGINYGQAPAFAQPVNYSSIVSNHVSLLNGSSAPAVIGLR